MFSIHFDFGTAVHTALETFLRKKKPITEEQAVKVFTKKLNWLVKKHNPKYREPLPEKDHKSLLQSGETIIRAVKNTPELTDVEVLFNEYPLFEDIQRTDDVSIKFKGFIDIVIKTVAKNKKTVLYVCDFKTCSWGWDRDTREDRWKHYQIFLYKYYLCKKFDIDPKDVRCAFILLKKRPPKGTHPIEFFPVSAGPVSVQRALDVLNGSLTEMSENIKTGDFKKNRASCVDKFNNRCPYFETELCPKDA